MREHTSPQCEFLVVCLMFLKHKRCCREFIFLFQHAEMLTETFPGCKANLQSERSFGNLQFIIDRVTGWLFLCCLSRARDGAPSFSSRQKDSLLSAEVGSWNFPGSLFRWAGISLGSLGATCRQLAFVSSYGHRKGVHAQRSSLLKAGISMRIFFAFSCVCG